MKLRIIPSLYYSYSVNHNMKNILMKIQEFIKNFQNSVYNKYEFKLLNKIEIYLHFLLIISYCRVCNTH